jgi:hypothetical protein
MISFTKRVDHVDITTTLRIYLEHNKIAKAQLVATRSFSQFTSPSALHGPELDIYMLNHILLAFPSRKGGISQMQRNAI